MRKRSRILVLALAGVAAVQVAWAGEQPIKKVKLVFATGILDAQISMWTAAALQTLVSGQAQFAIVNAASLLQPAAKGFLFAFNNPEAAIRLHWRLHPESKPKGKAEEEALREQLYLVKLRLPLYTFDDLTDRRWGAYTREEWATWARILGVDDKVKDLGAFHTNTHVEEINRFDPRKIEADARRGGR